MCEEGSAFCATDIDGTNPINNRFLKEFLWPSDQANCPDDTNVVINRSGEGNSIIKKHSFNGVLPNLDARNWNCKWKISASNNLLPTAISGTSVAEREKNGWI